MFMVIFDEKRQTNIYNIDKTMDLIGARMASFDLYAVESVAEVLFRSENIVRLSIKSASGYPIFNEKKGESGEYIYYNFDSADNNNDEKLVGSAEVWVVHDPNYMINMLLAVLVGGSIGFLCALPFIFVYDLRCELKDREASQQALQEREKNLSTMLDSIGDGVIATDAKGLVSRMNPVAERLTRWPAAEAIGQPLGDVFRVIERASREQVENPVEIITRTRQAVEMSDGLLLISKDGVEYYITNTAAPILHKDDQLAGIVIVFRDETEEILTRKKMREIDKMQAINVLVGGLAHDYNNLLGIISGAAEVLKLKNNEKLSSASHDLLNTMMQAVDRGTDLTGKLLGLANDNSPGHESYSLHSAIENVVDVMSQTSDRRFTITADLQAEYDIVCGNESEMENALLNIGLNARNAAKEDSSALEITTTLLHLSADDPEVRHRHAPQGKCICVALRDDGIGIPESYKERIFEPFFTSRSDTGGTGLGLATAYASVRDHGGVIHVESTEGVGSTFFIYLPCSEENTVGVEDNLKPIQKSTAKTVYIVDDEYGIQEILQEMLELLGHDVIISSGGEQAIEIFKNNQVKIDVVIMDLNMPKISGHDIIREIRKVSAEVPIIISSGNLNFESNRNNNNFISIRKPYKIPDLAIALEDALSQTEAVSLPLDESHSGRPRFGNAL